MDSQPSASNEESRLGNSTTKRPLNSQPPALSKMRRESSGQTEPAASAPMCSAGTVDLPSAATKTTPPTAPVSPLPLKEQLPQSPSSEEQLSLKPLSSQEQLSMKPSSSEEQLSPKPPSSEEQLSPKPFSSEEQLSPKPSPSEEQLSLKPSSSKEQLSPKPSSSQEQLPQQPSSSEEQLSPQPPSSEEQLSMKPSASQEQRPPQPSSSSELALLAATGPPGSEASASEATQPVSLAERLPDELLLLILGALRDASTLLDSVPLVCRRWYRLARDPRAWDGASVSLTYGITDRYSKPPAEVRVRTQEARFLLHAPASGSLHLDLTFSSRALKITKSLDDICDFFRNVPRAKTEKPRQVVPLSQVLSRCQARITAVCSNEMTDDEACKEVCRQQESDCWGYDYYSDPGPSTYKPLKAMLQVVAPNEKHLRKLVVKCSGYVSQSFAAETMSALTGDALLDAVRRCSALESLRCPAACVSALRALPALVELRLDMWLDMARPAGDWPSAGSLPALRSLDLPDYATMQEADYMFEGREWVPDLLEALADAAPGLERLALAKHKRCRDCGDDDSLVLDGVLDGLPRLRSLTLAGGPVMLSQLLEARLDALTELRASVEFCLDDYTLVDGKVDKLQERLPDVDVELYLTVMRPAETTYSWGRRQREKQN